MQSFINTLSQFCHLAPESTDSLKRIIGYHEFPGGHRLLPQDTVCNHLYFVEKGITRTFYLKDGKDVTDWISIENEFAVSLISMLNRVPDRRMIETVEPCVLYSIGYQDTENLCAKYHDIEHMMRKLVSFGLVQLQRRFDELHFATAKERYDRLLLERPSIIQRVPLGIVASYLGITQETLSRIRAKK